MKSRFISLVDDSTHLGVEELALEWYASEVGRQRVQAGMKHAVCQQGPAWRRNGMLV